MPVLHKAKYEMFAQEIAKGLPAAQAYVNAGYRPSMTNAGNLRLKKEIQIRVAELLEEREKLYGHAQLQAIEATGLTKEWVITNLMENALQCLGKRPVRVSVTAGVAQEIYERNPTAANRALELLGREKNMFIERMEVGDPGAWARMTDTELDQDLIDQAGKLGIPKQALAGLLTWEPPVEPEDDGEAK